MILSALRSIGWEGRGKVPSTLVAIEANVFLRVAERLQSSLTAQKGVEYRFSNPRMTVLLSAQDWRRVPGDHSTSVSNT